jgi:F-type H+-transporting ATPase subunit delta
MTRTQRARRLSRELFRNCLVDGVPDPARVRTVVRLIAASGARDRFKILTCFLRLVSLDVARRTATVESAEPLPPEVQSRLQADLATHYGPGLNTSFIHSPELIGGMRIRVGSDLYDGSVRGRLAALAARF